MAMNRNRMYRVGLGLFGAVVFLIWMGGPTSAGGEPPQSWIDADTGHRILRLTREPGSASMYFNQNGYSDPICLARHMFSQSKSKRPPAALTEVQRLRLVSCYSSLEPTLCNT